MHKTVKQVIAALNKNNMAGYFVNDSSELIQLLKTLIPLDSVTLEQTGVFEFLRNGNY